MFSRLKNGKKNKPPRTPTNTRIYAVGDVHGRYALLQQIHELIKKDSESAAGEIRKIIIYLGDYIDRGLESKQVIDCFVSEGMEGFERVFIKGNHEHAMLGFIDNPEIGEIWLTWGGYSTIQSYGVSLQDHSGKKLEMAELNVAFKKALPDYHVNFLNKLKINHVEGDYVFVHAGVRPGVELADQTDEDMMMIRGDFVYKDNPLSGKTVVFGHTMFEEAFQEPGKIGVDTGAYATGNLTCAVLEGESVKFISTQRS